VAYTDIVYEERDQIATIAINRPDVMNAFRGQTVEEMLQAMLKAGWDKGIAAIVLTGTGDRAFCTGGDQSAHSGQYDGRGTAVLPIEELHSAIRDVPKPVIARVQGYAIGGGNVLATLCDMTIASDKAVFGQVGPKVGSVDPGWGTSPPWSARRRRARSGTCAAAKARRKRWRWGCATWWCRTTSWTPRWPSGAANSSRKARPRSPSPSARSTPRPSTSAASAAWACRH